MPVFTREQLYTALNKPRTSSLFVETSRHGDNPVLTLRNNPSYLSLRDLYVQHTIDDPSENTFAYEVFGEWYYWSRLREQKHIVDLLPEWKVEADAARKKKAFKAIVHEVESGGKSAFSAAKFLIEEPWKDKRNPKTKKQAQESTAKAAQMSGLDEDRERLKQQGLLN